MMADFDKALPYVLANEGGFSNDPLDSGGATNMGITFAEAQKWGITSVDELKTIPMDIVSKIYKTDYWFMDGIQSQQVATKFFDMAVNRGKRRAILLLQEALTALQCVLVADGVYGPRTEAAINACDPSLLLAQLVDVNVKSYNSIVAAKPDQKRFLKGWLNRARKLPRLC